uniref:Uncharacterized protein n=1 Tax=Glossina palpalis gambiensis TaxID=67801 RepID=A0A1B0BMH5_9MUSC
MCGDNRGENSLSYVCFIGYGCQCVIGWQVEQLNKHTFKGAIYHAWIAHLMCLMERKAVAEVHKSRVFRLSAPGAPCPGRPQNVSKTTKCLLHMSLSSCCAMLIERRFCDICSLSSCLYLSSASAVLNLFHVLTVMMMITMQMDVDDLFFLNLQLLLQFLLNLWFYDYSNGSVGRSTHTQCLLDGKKIGQKKRSFLT